MSLLQEPLPLSSPNCHPLLLEAARLCQTAGHADIIAQSVLETIAQYVPLDLATLTVLDQGRQVLNVSAMSPSGEKVGVASTFQQGRELPLWVIQSGVSVLFPGQVEIPDSLQEVLKREHVVSLLAVPLKVGEQKKGALLLIRQEPGAAFAPLDQQLVSLVADRLTATLYGYDLRNQLQTRNQFIASILESIPSSVVILDQSQQIVTANQNFLDKSRHNAESAVGKKIEQILPSVLVKYTQMAEKIRRAFVTGSAVEGEKVAYRAPGLPTRIYYYRLIPLKAGNVVENVMLFMDDITEREQLGEEVRRAERHLASVVECANDLVVSMDPEGYIWTWNPTAEVVSGWEFEEVNHRPLVSLCATEQREVMIDLLRKLAQGAGVQSVEVNLMMRDGEQVPISWNFSAMRDDMGKVSGIVAVGRDLTEQRRLEAQLIHAAKMASLGGMARGIAHELRNPLGIISAGVQLMLENPQDTPLCAECAQRSYAAAHRASAIIENLLKFARPEGDLVKRVDLNAIVEETLAMLAHELQLNKVVLQKALQPNLPKCPGNPDLVQQVITNLILNACHAMPDGGDLRITTVAVGKDQVEISFTDTGRGIPPENLGKIFDPFFTTMPVGQGTGLGLSISYSIIRQHQGNIEVHSTEGKGSTFTVRLPSLLEGVILGRGENSLAWRR